MTTDGFYSIDENNELCYGSDLIQMPTGTVLLRDQHAEYTYPVDGWYWFDTLAQAEAALGTTFSPDPVNPGPIPFVEVIE